MTTTPLSDTLHAGEHKALIAKIAERQELSTTIINGEEDLIEYINTLIVELHQKRLEDASHIERRTQLEREVFACRHAILRELLTCWHDVTALQRELRHFTQERYLTEP